MNDWDKQLETLWAALHGRSDSTDEPVDAPAADSVAAQESRRLDRALRALAPELETTREDLVDEILLAMDREQEAAAPAAAPTGVPAPRVLPLREELGGIWRVLSAPVFQNWSTGLAAAAAALLILAGLPYCLDGAVDWAQPEFAQPAQRGAAPAVGVRTRADAAACLGGLQRAIRERLDAQGPSALDRLLRRRAPVVELTFRFEALPDGALLVAVDARGRDGGNLKRRWERREASVADFLAGADDLGAEIADFVAASAEGASS